jgi:hypothetical protein
VGYELCEDGLLCSDAEQGGDDACHEGGLRESGASKMSRECGLCLGGVIRPYSRFSAVPVELAFEAVYVELEFFMLPEVVV